MTAVRNPAARTLPPGPPGTRPGSRLAIVRLEGFVDRPALEACDYTLLKAMDTLRGAVIDLTAAQHLDYRAVDILVRRQRSLKARGIELAIAATHADVRHIVRAVASSLKVFPTLEEAAGWVRGESQHAVVARPPRGTTRTR